MKLFLKKLKAFFWSSGLMTITFLHWYIVPGRVSLQLLGISIAGSRRWQLLEMDYSPSSYGVGILGLSFYVSVAFKRDPLPSYHLAFAPFWTMVLESKIPPVDRCIKTYTMKEIAHCIEFGDIWIVWPVRDELTQKATDICIRDLVFGMTTIPRQ